MVQVLPYVPSFGDQLAQALTQAAVPIGEGLAKRQASKAFNKWFEPQPIPNPPGGAGTQVGAAIAGAQQALTQPAMGQQTPLQATLTQTQTPTPLGPSRYEQMMNAPGGPSPMQVMAFDQQARAAGIDPTVMTTMAINANKQAMKEDSATKQKAQEIQAGVVKKSLETDVGNVAILANKKADIDQALAAVRTGDVGGFDLNYVASLMGPLGEPLKNLPATQLDASMKNLTIDDVARITGQKNKWIEQQIRSALAGVGKTRENNEALLLSARNRVGIEELRLNKKAEVAQRYLQNGQLPPANLEVLAEKEIAPQVKLLEDKLAYRLRELYERTQPAGFLNKNAKVTQDTPLTLQKKDALLKQYDGDVEAAIRKALQLGYTIPDPETFKEG